MNPEKVSMRGYLFTELGFRVGFRVGFSSWIFEVGFFGGFPINFQWFYTTYFVSGVAHRGLFKMEEEDSRSVRAILFNVSYYCIRNCIFDWKQ